MPAQFHGICIEFIYAEANPICQRYASLPAQFRKSLWTRSGLLHGRALCWFNVQQL